MTYDQATIEKAARLLCEKYGRGDSAVWDAEYRMRVRSAIRFGKLSLNPDIEEALRRAVEETK